MALKRLVVRGGLARAAFWAQLDYVNAVLARTTRWENGVMRKPWVLPEQRVEYMQDLTYLLASPRKRSHKSRTGSKTSTKPRAIRPSRD